MADTPRGYRKETREVFVKRGADFSDSQKHRGLKSPLARDRKTSDLSHTLIGDRVEQDSAFSWVDDDREHEVEVSSEGVPDISSLVPLALVAVAGVAAGVAGLKIAQSAKMRHQTAPVEMPSVAAPITTPAGWYEVANDSTLLRYWDGVAWTDDYAQRARSTPSIAADWYPDPSNTAQLRYWDGTAWTHHVAPRPGAVTATADWYPDPSNAAQMRYWDGTAWTYHVTPGPHAVPDLGPASAPSSNGLAPAHDQSRINMSSAEWQAHVRAWLRAGAIHQELWRRLSNAHIHDADDATLTAQRKMEALTPDEGTRRIQQMLEANPALNEQGALLDFLQLFGGGRGSGIAVDMHRDTLR